MRAFFRYIILLFLSVLLSCYTNPAFDYLCSEKSDFDFSLPGNCEEKQESSLLLLILGSSESVSDQELQWARAPLTGPGPSAVGGLITDNTGNIYAAGYQYGQTPFDYGNGVQPVSPFTFSNALLLRYSPDGTAQSASTVLSGTNSSEFDAIAIDSAGNIYAGGNQNRNNTINYGNDISLSGAGSTQRNASLVAYDSAGTAQWGVTNTTGTQGAYFYGLKVSPLNQLIAVGRQRQSGTYTYGGAGFASPELFNYTAVIVRFDLAGNGLGATGTESFSGGSNILSLFYGVDTDFSGNIYAAGFQSVADSETINYGNGVTLPDGPTNLNSLLLKYDSGLTAQWGIAANPAPDTCQFRGVATDSAGNVYAVGYQTGTSVFHYGSLSVSGASTQDNAVIVKFDSAGVPIWARTIAGGSGASRFNAVTIDSNGNVYAAGYQTGTGNYSFGNGVEVAAAHSGFNALLVAYDLNGNPLWARSVVSGSDDSVYNAVAVNGTALYAAGYQTGTGSFTHAENATVAGPDTGNNLLIVRHR